MKAAKIISFIAFISSSYESVRSFKNFLMNLMTRQIFRESQIPIPIPWLFILDLIFAIGSIIYCFYLWRKEKKGEKVKFALLISIALLVTPFLAILLTLLRN